MRLDEVIKVGTTNYDNSSILTAKAWVLRDGVQLVVCVVITKLLLKVTIY